MPEIYLEECKICGGVNDERHQSLPHCFEPEEVQEWKVVSASYRGKTGFSPSIEQATRELEHTHDIVSISPDPHCIFHVLIVARAKRG